MLPSGDLRLLTVRQPPSDGLSQLPGVIGSILHAHGIQDAAIPTERGLCPANRRRLKISNIVALSRPHGGLAFLSACQTATGEEVLSDEAIHIAKGMLFAGYGGVIGTCGRSAISLRRATVSERHKTGLSGGCTSAARRYSMGFFEIVTKRLSSHVGL